MKSCTYLMPQNAPDTANFGLISQGRPYRIVFVFEVTPVYFYQQHAKQSDERERVGQAGFCLYISSFPPRLWHHCPPPSARLHLSLISPPDLQWLIVEQSGWWEETPDKQQMHSTCLPDINESRRAIHKALSSAFIYAYFKALLFSFKCVCAFAWYPIFNISFLIHYLIGQTCNVIR